jgi:hypothetical protein
MPTKAWNDSNASQYIVDNSKLLIEDSPKICEIIYLNTMNPQVTQQTREDAAQQLRQWALSRNVSLVQIEQMVMAVVEGEYDAQLLQARPAAQNHAPTYQHQQTHQQQHQQQQHQQQHHQPHQQTHTSTNTHQPPSFQTPFGTFPLPTMPQQPIPTIPGTYPPPATSVPNMFPTPSVQAASHVPGVQTTRTVFSGGEVIQQNSSYAGQQGNTTFQYSSTTTSMNFTPGAQQPPPSSMQYAQQPALPLPAIPPVQPPPTYTTIPNSSQRQRQPHPQLPQPLKPRCPSPSYMTLNAGSTPVVDTVPTPEHVFNPVAANQVPQNSRLADRFKRELTEATYFSDIPGMPDRGVQR